MTAEEKNTIARFLDLATDYLRDGYTQNRANETFQDDTPPRTLDAPASAGFSSLPLAYQINEDGDDDNPAPPNGETLADIAAAINHCEACDLATTRKNAVPGEGAASPLVMVIGEGPGADEDTAGRPFVGKAGQLLDKMLASIGLFRDKNCYIANMVKCRPPGNRDPNPEEIAACSHFLKRQITLLRPRMILCAGRVAAQNLLKTNKGINALRGSFFEYTLNPAAEWSGGEKGETIPVLCAFHPSAILRDESLKRPAWEDLKLLKSRLDSLNEE